MKLTNTGTIKDDDYNIRFTQEGKWMVSRSGTVIGYVDTLDEVPALVESKREKVRARLARVEAEHAERMAERQAEKAAAMRGMGRSCQGFDYHGEPI